MSVHCCACHRARARLAPGAWSGSRLRRCGALHRQHTYTSAGLPKLRDGCRRRSREQQLRGLAPIKQGDAGLSFAAAAKVIAKDLLE